MRGSSWSLNFLMSAMRRQLSWLVTAKEHLPLHFSQFSAAVSPREKLRKGGTQRMLQRVPVLQKSRARRPSAQCQPQARSLPAAEKLLLPFTAAVSPAADPSPRHYCFRMNSKAQFRDALKIQWLAHDLPKTQGLPLQSEPSSRPAALILPSSALSTSWSDSLHFYSMSTGSGHCRSSEDKQIQEALTTSCKLDLPWMSDFCHMIPPHFT